MYDPRHAKLAKLLVNYSVNVQPGDLVAITSLTSAEALIIEIYQEILKCGGFPYFLARAFPPTIPGLENPLIMRINLANEDQLNHVDILWKQVVEEFDVVINILSESNTQSYANLDPEKMGAFGRAHACVINTYFERQANKQLKRVTTLFPTQGIAQDAEMPLEDYEEFLFSSCYCDRDEPGIEWQRTKKEQQKVVDYLNGKNKIEIKGPNIELSLSVEGRTFINCAGEVNMPDGEIFTGPVEDSVNGWVHFTYPDYTSGREIRDIQLEFKDGRVEKATASKNQDTLFAELDLDAGSRYLGEFGIGTNSRINRFTRCMLFDEKIGGTIHFALGHGYLDSGSKNESSIHKDMLCDMKDGGEIYVDDKLIYKSGDFLIK